MRQLTPTLESCISKLRAERSKLKNALLAHNTQRGYRYDWLVFTRWTNTVNLAPLPATAETVSLYATALLSAGRKVSTTARRLAVIGFMHRAIGIPSPVTEEVRELLRGARRSRQETVRQVEALSLDALRSISRVLERDRRPIAIRNRAILLLGWASALRSANLAALQVSDIRFDARGLVLTIRREKQNQEGEPRLIGVPYGRNRDTCPVRSLKQWLQERGDGPGAVFTNLGGGMGAKLRPIQPERYCQIVQQCVAKIGLDPKKFGSHSLRSGFITEAGERDIGELRIASHSGHRDMATLRRYFRPRDVWRANACAALGL